MTPLEKLIEESNKIRCLEFCQFEEMGSTITKAYRLGLQAALAAMPEKKPIYLKPSFMEYKNESNASFNSALTTYSEKIRELMKE